MTLNIATTTATAVPPGLILFGRDERHRPHASRFDAGDKAEAERAAGLMGMHVLEISDDTHHSLAAGLPQGRLFGSGKAFVPFVKAEVFDRLVAAAGLPDVAVPVRASAKAAGAPPASGGGASGDAGAGGPGGRFKAPTDWPEIERGCLVLACAGPQEGWFEAIIMYTKADDAFELQWRDWPDDGLITRHRSELGLLPPGACVDAPCLASMIFEVSAGSSIGRVSGLMMWPSMTPRAGMLFGRLGSHRFRELHALERRV